MRVTESINPGDAAATGPSSSTIPPFTASLLPVPKGALLGVDYGTKRIGLAVCDPERVIASPLDTLAAGPTAAALVAALAARSNVVGIVVGLPLHASGEESDMSRAARAFARQVADLTKLPAVMWDERYTSHAAEDALRGAKLTHKKRKAKVDRVAAQMILRAYLDAGCPPAGSDAEPGATSG